MGLSRYTCRRLQEEHEATLALWGRVERVLGGGRSDAALLRQAAAALDDELARHFEFEERALFPRLAEAGEGDLAELLLEEHATIREAAAAFAAELAADASGAGARRLALELAERLAAHVGKEEMSLLPSLDDLLDEALDAELLQAYAFA